MGLRCGLVKSELKYVRKAYDNKAPVAKIAKALRVKPEVIVKCYASFKAADEKAAKVEKPETPEDFV